MLDTSPVSPDEESRLLALDNLRILETSTDPALDDLVAIAAQALDMPIAYISIVDRERQWLKSRYGIDIEQTPRDESICAQTIRHDALLEVSDLRADVRFRDSPCVANDPHMRFYAGMPLNADGYRIGALCVADRQPRQLSQSQRELLGRLSNHAMGVIRSYNVSRRLQVAQAKWQRLAFFNALLADANEVIATEDDEGRMLQRICDLAVQAEGILLAYVAAPDSSGRLQVKMAAGPRDYLDNLYISIDPAIPEGQGPAGRVWRKRKSIYLPSFDKSPLLEPWRKLGERYGFKAVATLPVARDGQRWGIMTLLHEEEGVFTDEFKYVVEELARNIARGLDRIDALERERQLRVLQDVLLDQTVAGILMLREGGIVSANKRFCSMLKCVSFEQLNNRPLESLCARQEDRERMACLYGSLCQTGSVKALNVRLSAVDGSELVCDVAAGVHSRDGHLLSVWTFQDVYERSRIEETLEYYALHDALTGLHNRRGLEQHLRTAIARARRTGSALAVGLFDLDDFKKVNDLYGHETGDHLLREFARRVMSRLRQPNLLARLGGDEFIVVIEDLGEVCLDSQLSAVAQRLREAATAPFDLGSGVSVTVGMSVGFARFPNDSDSAGELIRLADAAMYEAKFSGKGG